MNERKKVLTTMRRRLMAISGWKAIAGLGVLTLVLVLAALSATNAVATHEDVEVWPAYYDLLDDAENSTTDWEEVNVLMYPIGHNKTHPQDDPDDPSCFGFSPNITKAKSTQRHANSFYILAVPGATQMHCPDGTGMHDMMVTKMPGDRGYSPMIQFIVCTSTVAPNVWNYDFMPYTSVDDIENGPGKDQIGCDGPFPADKSVLSPVVLGSYDVVGPPAP